MAKQVFSKEERHAQAVKIGIKFGKQVGLGRVSIGSVAGEMGVTAPLLFHVFGSRAGFHKAIAKAAKAAGVVFPEAQPTVRAERAARRVERDKTVKKLKAPKVVAPKAAKKGKKVPVAVTPPKMKPPAKKAAAKKAAAPKVTPPKPAAKKANGKVRVPKALPAELAKFPSLPVPTAAVAEPAAAA